MCVNQVPTGGVERMKAFPALTSQEVRLEGRGHLEAAADIKLSSAGERSIPHRCVRGEGSVVCTSTCVCPQGGWR